MTFAGDATLSTATPKFGTAALNLPDTSTSGGQNVYTPIVAGQPLDILSGSADFTIEGFFQIAAGHTGSALCILDYGNDHSGGGFNPNTHGIVLFADDAHFDIQTAIPTWGGISNAVVVSTGVYHHWAIVRHAGVGTLYLDGNAQAGGPTWTGFTLSGGYSGFVNIGGSQTFNGGVCPGQVDEVRVTAGIALYTSNFTPPATVFPTISCTPTIPNVVGQTRAVGTATIVAAGFQVTTIQASSSLAAGDIITSHNPGGGSTLPLGGNVTITVSTGPAMTVRVGGDTWGASGGDQNSNGTPEILGHLLANASQPINALNVVPNQSVSAALSLGKTITQATPAFSVPTTPKLGPAGGAVGAE